MEHAALSPLAAWESFYVIVGSSAAALTGLQFVVIVLAAEMDALGSGSGPAHSAPRRSCTSAPSCSSRRS